MENPVEVMNQLLNQSQNVALPPIPQNVPMNKNQSMKSNMEMENSAIAFDVLLTAAAMAIENFLSATNMKNPQVKRIQVEMPLQQLEIAKST